MPKILNLTGQTFGRWSVIGQGEVRGGNRYYDCRCECGTERPVLSPTLRSGGSKSCGCLGAELASERLTERLTTHGQSDSREFASWWHMRMRCTNPNNDHYNDYGGRGITVCERWDSFANFLADMGPRPDGKTLDRYPNPDGNYELSNCRWATRKEQQQNRRTNIFIQVGNKQIVLWEALARDMKAYHKYEYFRRELNQSPQTAYDWTMASVSRKQGRYFATIEALLSA